ncbi:MULTISPECIES: acetate kinase [Segatella]|jgi:acetate kinase|uniref:Acetate kinase n=2 Tax=Segatella TaxID=2974251 RepID=D8DU70_9BACT|nr:MULTISPECIES: acetate kinase [Segatella]MEE3414939.1 acetate kinase [Prevotella sp.]EFI73015.1 acetate kinase [Segatella baroniae B14]MDR4931979.1 acetate kinase [Segatella bryantii]OYP55594.1 acetate kinase [Segatella bryantii]UKK72695.1 acetate kinase [Segatella bryantii]
MKILVLNCGSSSIKYKLYDMANESVLAQGGVERIGIDGAFIKVTLPNGEKKQINAELPTHKEGVNLVFKCLLDKEFGAIKDLKEIDAVGHRIVQGGDKYNQSVIVDQSVEEGIEELCDLAPVHNAGHLKGIRAVDALMPGTPQVCVFDNAFHSTMPDYAYLYAIPYEVYEKYHVRRYGFHGTSHRYVSKRAIDMLGLDPNNSKIVTCHIGNGASCSAVVNGKVMDTSMGLTPLAGVMMGSRSGDIDPSAVTYIMDKLGKQPQEMADYLNKESGLLGISGVSSDMRDVYDASVAGNKRAQLAIKMYTYRIKKYIGSYAAAMGGVDAIIFTAGVGENQAQIRQYSLEGLEFLGVELDKEVNLGIHGKEAVISTANSKVKVAVIPTDEEIVIARDTQELVSKL